MEILSASEWGLLSMSSCVVLTVLEKVSITEFEALRRVASRCEVLVCLSTWQLVDFVELVALWVRNVLKWVRIVKFVCLARVVEFVELVTWWGSYCLKVSERCWVYLFGKGGWVCLVLWCRDCLPVSEVGWVCLLMYNFNIDGILLEVLNLSPTQHSTRQHNKMPCNTTDTTQQRHNGLQHTAMQQNRQNTTDHNATQHNG